MPSLSEGGGVPSVADFICTTAERSGEFQVRLISLATGASGSLNLMLKSPRSWLKGARVDEGLTWRSRSYVEVGSIASELEFQRFRPRSALSSLLKVADVIQVVCGSAAWAHTVLKLNKPVSLQVATRAIIEREARDAGETGLLNRWRRLMTHITDAMDNSAIRSVDAIQVENAWMFEYANQLNHDRTSVDIRYAPPGIDTDLFRPADRRHEPPRRYIFCVGRMNDPRKNIGLLLEAFSELRGNFGVDFDMILAGSAAPPDEFWRRAESLHLQGAVRFINRPSTEELIALYQGAEVFALASEEEGLGMVVLEAMSCGLPVVSTRCGGPEGIISHGQDGYLVPRNDSTAMAEHILKIIRDTELRQQLSLRARQKIVSNFSLKVAGDRFIEVWHGLLNRTRI